MFDTITRFALQNRAMIILLALAATVYGSILLPQVPVDVFPNLNRPLVTVMTEAHGLAPDEVEKLVTFPLESALNGTPGVVRVRSSSAPGLSIVYAEFDWSTDVYRNRQLVTERLLTAANQLPADITPQLAPISSIMGEIMLVGVSAANGSVSPMDLRSLADWTIRPRLLSIPGISQVTVIGGQVKQIRVAPDPQRLRLYHLGIEDIARALKNFGVNTSGGFLEQGARELVVRPMARSASPEDVARAVVTVRNGSAITVGMLAEVGPAPGVKRGDGSVNGQPAVIMAIQKQPDANSLRLTEQVETALAALQKTMPAGVKADQVLFRQADFIQRAVDNVRDALRDGVILVVIVLTLFLMNARTTLISLIAIPLSLLLTVMVFKLFNLSINTMTLGGLAIAVGELVDDAVVYVENILRRLRENRVKDKLLPALRVAFQASHEVRSSVVIATAIVILVFIPLFFLSGVEGRLFKPLGVAYIVSILASLAVALTLTPVLSHLLLAKAKVTEQGDSRLVAWLKRRDATLLAWSYRHPAWLLSPAILALILATASIAWMGKSFLPAFNEGTATVNIFLSPGTSLGASNAIGMQAERLLLEIPEVVAVGRRTGRAELDEHAEGVHYSEIDVDLKPLQRPMEVVFADMRAKLGALPGGASVSIGQPIAHRLDHLLSGVRSAIAVKLFGPDLATLRTQAEAIRQAMASVPGVVDLSVERQVDVPQLRIRLDREAAARLGVNADEAARMLETALNGEKLAVLVDEQQRLDLVLRLADSDRNAIDTLNTLTIPAGTGSVPLSAVAEIYEAPGPNMVNRENAQRRIIISANAAGRDLGSVVTDIQAAIAKQVQLPAGYFISTEGQFESQQAATRLIAILGLFSLLGIFGVLYSHFHSARLAALVMVNIPMALIGAVAAIWLTGGILSVASLVGFVTLTGIAARNGILKLTHYLNLMRHEGEVFGEAMVTRGSLERLTPVLMTALTAMLALLPLILGGHLPGREILYPVAAVIFGGLLSATLLDTLITPVLFLKFGRKAADQALARMGRGELSVSSTRS